MKKTILLAFLLIGSADYLAPTSAVAAPASTTAIARSPNRMEHIRRRLRRQAAMRMRQNKRMH